MKKIITFLKPWDYILITFAVFLSFLPTIVTAIQYSMQPEVTNNAMEKESNVSNYMKAPKTYKRLIIPVITNIILSNAKVTTFALKKIILLIKSGLRPVG